jgi:hypothetical protein
LRRNLAVCFFAIFSGNVTNVDPSGITQTFAYSINDNSEVEGYLADSHQLCHGPLREPSGSLGQWTHSQFLQHGFLGDSSGNVASLSAPVSNTGTYPDSINNSGHRAGYYYDLNEAVHGFVQYD